MKKSKITVSVTRLRPERPKREIPDYEYRDDYTRISVGNGNTQLKTISKKMKLIGEDDYGDEEDVFVNGKAGYDRSDSVEVTSLNLSFLLIKTSISYFGILFYSGLFQMVLPVQSQCY